MAGIYSDCSTREIIIIMITLLLGGMAVWSLTSIICAVRKLHDRSGVRDKTD